LLQENNIYEREALVFPNYPFDEASFNYTTSWIEDRIAFLDIYFNYNPLATSHFEKTDFRVYPNPAETHIRIQTDYDLTNEPYQIVNIQGKAVKSGLYNGKELTIENLIDGFYILKIKNLSAKIVVR